MPEITPQNYYPEISHDRLPQGLIPECYAGQFLYGRGLPKSLAIKDSDGRGHLYAVEARTETTNIRRWLGVISDFAVLGEKSLTWRQRFANFGTKIYGNPDARRFADALLCSIERSQAGSLTEAIKGEMIINSGLPSGSDLNPQIAKSMSQIQAEAGMSLREDAWSRVLGWLDGVTRAGMVPKDSGIISRTFDKIRPRPVPVIEHAVKIVSKDLNYRRIIIGNVSREDQQASWQTDAAIASAFLLFDNRLGFSPQKDLLIVSVSLPDVINPERTDIMESNLRYLIEFSGYFEPDNNVAIVINRSRGSAIDTKLETEIGVHEAAHAVIGGRAGTPNQLEAFTQAASMGFGFSLAKSELRSGWDYGRKITKGQLEELFSENCTRSVPAAETYGLCPAFYCFIYEKLGPEKFVQFIRLLGGSADAVYSESRGWAVLDHIGDRKDTDAYKCRGNIVETIKVAMAGVKDCEGKSADDFIEEFLGAINS